MLHHSFAHLRLSLKNKTIMKTTILGILTIVSSLANVGVQIIQGGTPDFMGAFAAVTAGIGLIKAKDNK
jgi:hypothetical protein